MVIKMAFLARSGYPNRRGEVGVLVCQKEFCSKGKLPGVFAD